MNTWIVVLLVMCNIAHVAYGAASKAPSKAPTAKPVTSAPSFTPTEAVVDNPTTVPTIDPIASPTESPTTLEPTASPSIESTAAATVPIPDDSYELFAVLTGTSCAEALVYGPSDITTSGQVGGDNTAYLATNTADKDTLHRSWLQIVTSDGVTELFRIYWTFATPRTLADHFITAVDSGETVGYRVVRYDGTNYFYNGVWRFSDLAANMAAKFASPVSVYSFSAKDGAWGGGDGTINGNGAMPQGSAVQFWGVGNFGDTSGGTDFSNCIYVYQQASATYYPGVKTYMYYSNEVLPTADPIATPTGAPVALPTAAPSTQPTDAPITTPTAGPTAVPTEVPIALPTAHPTASPTSAPTVAPTNDPTAVPSVAPSVAPTVVPSVVPTTLPTDRPTAKPSVLPTGDPIATPTGAPIAEPSFAPISVPTVGPTHNPTEKPTEAPTRTPTVGPTHNPTGKPSDVPTHSPTVAPTHGPTTKPSDAPTRTPTAAPTRGPTVKPSVVPTRAPTAPSKAPTRSPTAKPSTRAPTVKPTLSPSRAPSRTPTRAPSFKPTLKPSLAPSKVPTRAPTRTPTRSPTTVKPSLKPTFKPSLLPTLKPSAKPSLKPSAKPSVKPSAVPTRAPTRTPTRAPSRKPTSKPSSRPPTRSPTRLPTTAKGAPSLRPSRLPTRMPTKKHSTCSIKVVQIIIRLAIWYYEHNSHGCNEVLKSSIVAMVPGVTTSDIDILQVSAVAAPIANLRVGTKDSSDEDAVSLEYTITVPTDSGLTYESMSAQIVDGVQSDTFTALVQQYAVEQNVTELYSASSSSVETSDVTVPDPVSSSRVSNDSVMGNGAIIGVAIGGCALLVLVFFLARYLRSRRAGNAELSNLTTLENTASKSPMTYDLELSKDIKQRVSGDATHGGSHIVAGEEDLPVAAVASPLGHGTAHDQAYDQEVAIAEACK